MLTKREREIYKNHGIETTEKGLVSPYGVIAPMLKNNNRKVGAAVFTFGTLPTNKLFQTEFGVIPGTCPCTCEKGYCTRGCYNFPAVKRGMAIKTLLCYKYPVWVKSAIMAQLEYLTETGKIKAVRIHDTGDFFAAYYVNLWIDIIKAFPAVKFWTYTKTEFKNAFDGLDNANIVESVIPGIGFNFGHIDHVVTAYKTLQAAGEKPYICRCGIDPNQHCENCTHCSLNKFVLFVEHSTEYSAANDSWLPYLTKLINEQPEQ